MKTNLLILLRSDWYGFIGFAFIFSVWLALLFYSECQSPLGDLHYLKPLVADFNLLTDEKLSGQSLADGVKHFNT